MIRIYYVYLYVYVCNLVIMSEKLTLSVQKKIIERARKYARKKGISISFLVENYLSLLSSEIYPVGDKSITPLVENLSGVIKVGAKEGAKKAYREHLENKYK